MVDENPPVDPVVMTSIGISVNTAHGEEINRRLEQAMADAVLACAEEGISTEEKNSDIIRARMEEARVREMEKIAAGE